MVIRPLVSRAALASAIWLASGAMVRVDQTSSRPSQSEGIRVRVESFEITQAWFRSVKAHELGEWDSSAAQVASLPPSALTVVRDDVHMIYQLLQAAVKGDTSVKGGGKLLKLRSLAPLMGLTDDELDLPVNSAFLADPACPARRVISRIMTRAAMLHTRVAMQDVGDRPVTRESRTSESLRAFGAPPPAGSAVRIRDGLQTQIADRSIHWAIAREAFDIVLPAPAASELSQVWYHAAMSYMQGQRNYASLLPHLEHARGVLPSDASVFLFSGAAYENVAAPTVQAALDENAGSRVALDSPPELLKKAERYLRRALEIDPQLAQARLRLGHVLELTGRHDEAAGLLREAERALAGPVSPYYAALFLGRAEESRGRDRDADARAAYERAVARFPAAQSPRLALATMDWRAGGQDAALSALQALSAGNPPDRRSDPWWAYDISHVGDVTALFRDLRARADEAVR